MAETERRAADRVPVPVSRPAPGPAYRSPAERAERGRRARARVPRAAHALLDPPARDPVAALERQAATRVPELVPVRHGRMITSPFSFFRGAALVMAGDLAGTPTTGITVQLCGDAHLANFGLFASPERRLVFDLNDFDETHPGPWEWDVKRLTASLAVAGRENGFGRAQRRSVVQAAAARYRLAMRELAALGNLEVWYAHLDADAVQARLHAVLDPGQRKRLARSLERARSRDSLRALANLATVVDGEPRIVADPPLVVPVADLLPDVARDRLEAALRELVAAYGRTLAPDRRALLEQFRVVDFARKVVGVGSVGTRAWIILLLGRDASDPLFLQAKEAAPSVLAGLAEGGGWDNEGQRVADGQRLMQAASDIFLGWEQVSGIDGRRRDFYVRQLSDWKGSAVVETQSPADMHRYGELCAWTLARAHARSGDRIAIAAYLGSGNAFDRAVTEFAEAYADQNERDHRALERAVEEGRVAATTGV